MNKFNLNAKTFIVAEVGNNHEGNIQIAKRLVYEAAAAGVDAIKFQTFVPELYVSSADRQRLHRLKKFQLSTSEIQELSKLAIKSGLIFFSTPFDLKSAEMLDNFQSIYKISSGDNNFWPLIDFVSSLNKPTMISTGMSSLESLQTIYDRWYSSKSAGELAFLHCVSAYPVEPENVNLAAIGTLKKAFPNTIIGYSDHAIGIKASLYAAAMGARVIEKHFTLDNNYSDFRDHQLSANPTDMKKLVDEIRLLETYAGNGMKILQPCEIQNELSMRRSLTALKRIYPGDIISPESVAFIRPGGGVSPGEEAYFYGRRSIAIIEAGEQIKLENLDNL